jgi:hypothetical protein
MEVFFTIAYVTVSGSVASKHGDHGRDWRSGMMDVKYFGVKSAG